MLYPLKFQPILKDKIWGGQKLPTDFYISLPPPQNAGESWEISDVEGDVYLLPMGLERDVPQNS